MKVDGHIGRKRITPKKGAKPIPEAVLLAEKAVGQKLPKGFEVHHVDNNKHNNAPSNLVVCPDRNYHMLLHARTRAYDACGNANWKKCPYCKIYDAPENLVHRFRKSRPDGMGTWFHRTCESLNTRTCYARKRTV